MPQSLTTKAIHMTDQPQFRFITRPYHRSLDQQIAAIFEAAAKWSAQSLPLADQAQLLLASDRILAKEIRNLPDLYGQPPNRAFALVPAQNRDLVAAFADRSHATADIRHLTVSPPYRQQDLESIVPSSIQFRARAHNYRHIVTSAYPHQHEIISALKESKYQPAEFEQASSLMVDVNPQTFIKSLQSHPSPQPNVEANQPGDVLKSTGETRHAAIRMDRTPQTGRHPHRSSATTPASDNQSREIASNTRISCPQYCRMGAKAADTPCPFLPHISAHFLYQTPHPAASSPQTNTVSPFHLYAKHDDATQPVLIPLCVFLLNLQIWPANTMSPFPEQL